MAFATTSRKLEDVKQSGGNYINKSGIYPVHIIAPLVNVSKNGSTSVDLYLEHEGQKQVIYGNMRITNNDGSTNEIGAKVFNQLLVIADLDSVADPVEAELPIGKKGELKDCAVLEDLADIDVIMRVQMEYDKWKGSYTEKKVIKGFYRAEDKATAEEIVNETNIGKGYENDQAYKDNITYKDNVTPEEIASWIAAKRPEGTAGDTVTTATKAPKFGKKRFGKKAE